MNSPRFTIRNVKAIEDSAGDRAPGIEARFGRDHLDSGQLGITYFQYALERRRRAIRTSLARRAGGELDV